MKDAISRGEVPLLDVEISQDGTISPEFFRLFQTIRKVLKPAPVSYSAAGQNTRNSTSTTIISRISPSPPLG